MCLEADQPVHDVDARLFEQLRPFDVRLLVEARLELDERDHLLVLLGGVDERPHELAVGAGGAVQRLLDREDVRVAGGLLDERLDGGRERVVRVVHEHVALLEDAEHVGRSVGAHEGRLRLRGPRLVLQLGPVEVVQPPQPAEAEGAVDDVDVGVAELELAAQELEYLVAHLSVDLEPYDRARTWYAGAG